MHQNSPEVVWDSETHAARSRLAASFLSREGAQEGCVQVQTSRLSNTEPRCSWSEHLSDLYKSHGAAPRFLHHPTANTLSHIRYLHKSSFTSNLSIPTTVELPPSSQDAVLHDSHGHIDAWRRSAANCFCCQIPLRDRQQPQSR